MLPDCRGVALLPSKEVSSVAGARVEGVAAAAAGVAGAGVAGAAAGASGKLCGGAAGVELS